MSRDPLKAGLFKLVGKLPYMDVIAIAQGDAKREQLFNQWIKSVIYYMTVHVYDLKLIVTRFKNLRERQFIKNFNFLLIQNAKIKY